MLEGFSLKDNKAGTFSPPMFYKNAFVATRNIVSAAQDPNSMLGKYPADYELWRICKFNDDTGEIEEASPALVVPIHALLQEKNNAQAN